jgi:hypothetical protein
MKHIRKFNENKEEVKEFKNTDDDIRMFFTDYTDENSNALTIKNGLVYDGRFIDDTSYMKNPSKYRRAKLITLSVCDADGISTPGMGKCITNLEVLQNLLDDIKRFYALSGEDINYSINTDYSGLEVQFIVLGDVPKDEESQSDKIDGYLQRVKEWVRKKGHKKQTISGNWLDMRFSKKGYDYYISQKLRKVGDGIITLDNTTDDSDRELINIRNEAWEDGLKFNISGGDNQVVLKLVKR